MRVLTVIASTVIATIELLSSSHVVEARPATPGMSCSQAARLVASQRAIVLTTGRGAGGELYDRYVSNGGFCPAGLYGRAAFVPTRDNASCNIGYYCTSARPDFSRD